MVQVPGALDRGLLLRNIWRDKEYEQGVPTGRRGNPGGKLGYGSGEGKRTPRGDAATPCRKNGYGGGENIQYD